MVKLIGGTRAVAALRVEGAAEVWRATAHIAIVVSNGSCTEAVARKRWRGLVVLPDGRSVSAISRRPRAARAGKVPHVEVDKGTDAGLIIIATNIDVSER